MFVGDLVLSAQYRMTSSSQCAAAGRNADGNKHIVVGTRSLHVCLVLRTSLALVAVVTPPMWLMSSHVSIIIILLNVAPL